jgi:YHS domain-containing protein
MTRTLTYTAAVAALLLSGTLLLTGCSQKQDAVVIQGKPYPLDTCLVCDMKLSGMGTPYVFAYHGQQIKVCDKSEKADFDKEPAKYMKKLADAEAQLKK